MLRTLIAFVYNSLYYISKKALAPVLVLSQPVWRPPLILHPIILATTIITAPMPHWYHSTNISPTQVFCDIK